MVLPFGVLMTVVAPVYGVFINGIRSGGGTNVAESSSYGVVPDTAKVVADVEPGHTQLLLITPSLSDQRL